MGIFDRFKAKKSRDDQEVQLPASNNTNYYFIPTASSDNSIDVSANVEALGVKAGFRFGKKNIKINYPSLVGSDGSVRSFNSAEHQKLLEEIQKVHPATSGASAEETIKNLENILKKKTNPTEGSL